MATLVSTLLQVLLDFAGDFGTMPNSISVVYSDWLKVANALPLAEPQ
jgi:hypothetical protein